MNLRLTFSEQNADGEDIESQIIITTKTAKFSPFYPRRIDLGEVVIEIVGDAITGCEIEGEESELTMDVSWER